MEARGARGSLGREAVRGRDQPARDDRAGCQPLDGWSGAPARLTKLAYAERLAAAIALLFLRQRDAVGLVRFDDVVRSSVPPRVRTGQWVRLVAALEEPGAGRASHAAQALEAAGRLIARRGMVVLISDLLMDRRGRRGDRARAATCRATGGRDAHARSRGAAICRTSNEALFVDPESGARGGGDRGRCARGISAPRCARRSRNGGASLTGYGASYEPVITDAPFGVPLRRAFSARQDALP